MAYADIKSTETDESSRASQAGIRNAINYNGAVNVGSGSQKNGAQSATSAGNDSAESGTGSGLKLNKWWLIGGAGVVVVGVFIFFLVRKKKH